MGDSREGVELDGTTMNQDPNPSPFSSHLLSLDFCHQKMYKKGQSSKKTLWGNGGFPSVVFLQGGKMLSWAGA